ncbi:MBL fold metallo-hydrolase [Fusibacter sp. JL298sf-3]
MEILTLVDNVVYGEGLIAEHGLSFLIQFNQKRILFGTGRSEALLHNAGVLGVELSDVDYVVISHIHEHLEGLEAFLKVNDTAVIYLKACPFATEAQGVQKRFSRYNNKFVYLKKDLILDDKIHLITDIYVYGSGEDDYLKRETDPQKASSELFMVLRYRNKQVLFTGCSPKGILNVLKTAYQKTGKKIYAVCGGMHFNGDILHELDSHLQRFSIFGIQNLYTNHCTGIDGYMRLKTTLQANVKYAFTGYHFEIE